MFLSRYHISDEIWMTWTYLSQTHSYFLYGLLILVIILDISDISANKWCLGGIVNIKLLLIKDSILLMSHMQKQETDFSFCPKSWLSLHFLML